jgi:hypothetical protein
MIFFPPCLKGSKKLGLQLSTAITLSTFRVGKNNIAILTEQTAVSLGSSLSTFHDKCYTKKTVK